ncbi:RagB/SusD family nutrient uptake outer membrane protein [Flavobacterium undicola]|uniref:RagB/SusD family nutrient uptake outer membrane protein n=1 Tax=Flavobacterium undicola TaxID=1932779 RepID=UPI001378ABB9|nr:RagB/SusD family nutrient uptake outer membrane protein [Flavobacterium undicola]MBA0884026.1 RagB/SusD family nutrient uptake outer membrane protein [Flavobacterium undicola]
MKRKIIYLGLLSAMMFTSCQEYLETQSDSNFDSEFVFQSASEADKALLGAYQLVSSESGIHSNRLFYEVTGVGSDIELGPEFVSNSGRYNGENLYYKTPTLADNPPDAWNGIYKTINRCNVIIAAFEKNAAYIAADKTKVSTLTHLYGEAVAIRATMYFELTRNWGDVIYFTKPILSESDYKNEGLTDRNIIQESELNNLIRVEPMMSRLNSVGNATTATRMTKEYVQGLIGRLALIRGGYALRPPSYTGDGDVIQSHSTKGKMVRRTDYLKYYTLANTYLKKLVYEGNAKLVTTDSRTPVQKFSNPFQAVFQSGMDYNISPEMIFEVSQTAGSSTERPYAFGRPSGGGSTAYPPKAYGQIRFFPTYYFGMFDNKDLRRDVTVTTTGLGGVADEKMLLFKKGSTTSGGLSLNKWDYSRMTDKKYATQQRVAGINAPVMRMGDMILLLAETYSVLGDDTNARTELLKIRRRAFNPSDTEYTIKTTTYVNSKSGASLLTAIQDERAFELGGEGQRKMDLVRWGLLGKKVNELQTQMTAMADALRANGSYTFPNGNVISSYIYTKTYTLAQAQTLGLNDILTGNNYVSESDPLYPLLFPGWRGTATDWIAPATVTLKKSMLAIKGLFKPLTTPEITAATTAGYAKVAYGIDLVNDTSKPWEVNTNGVFGGYLPADFTANYAPLYLVAIPAATIQASGGKVSNDYGFPNQ